MKFIATFLFLLLLSNPLLAQPIFTLSASAFYLGDAPGSYTVTCPTGTSAAVNALTKIADVPLFSPASNQYGVGVTFSPPASSNSNILVGTLPQSTTLSVMGGNVVYAVGVLAGVASCNALPAINTTSASFTLTLGGMTRTQEQAYIAQRTWALKANSVKLPQLTTAEQTALPPQQPGNVLYNTDEQKMAIHNGSSWQYLAGGTATGQFQNERGFINPVSSWTVPAGVTRVMAEVWAGGAGGSYFTSINDRPTAIGGGAGGYVRSSFVVTPGSVLTITVGSGGSGDYAGNTNSIAGGFSGINYGGVNVVSAIGGDKYGNGGLGVHAGSSSTQYQGGLGVGGGNGTQITWSYNQQASTTYFPIMKCGNGGTAYGAQPGGFGDMFQFANGVAVGLFQGNSNTKDGTQPGGGGGGGYAYGGYGGGGLVVLRW